MERFSRTIRMIGKDNFEYLQNRSITIVGLGAVGGYALEGLVRAGVTNLKLVDFDKIHFSNINRQILATDNTVGQPKVDVARERAIAINPKCQIETLQIFAGEDSLQQILSPKTDLLIDAIDSLTPKAQLLIEAYKQDYNIISSMGAALRTDPTMIAITDLMSTTSCPLARRLRKILRKQGVGKGIQAIFSTEKVNFSYEEPQEHDSNTEFSNRGRHRRTLGSLPTITGIFGLMIANLAIQRLISL